MSRTVGIQVACSTTCAGEIHNRRVVRIPALNDSYGISVSA